MSGKIAELASAFPGEASTKRFFDEFEKRQTNVEIAGQSYRALHDSAKESAEGRVRLAYFIFTLSLGLIAWYYNLSTRSDSMYEVLRHFVPAIGLFSCFVIMTIAQYRYAEECKYTAAMIKIEEARGEMRGAGRVRAEVLQYNNWWALSRVDAAGICAAIAWTFIFVVQAWYS